MDTNTKQGSIEARHLYSGLIRLHILHHSAEEEVFGLGMIEELARHGYKLSPGTLYPILHGLEGDGLLRSDEICVGGKIRRLYRITTRGRKVLTAAKEKVRELFGELFEKEAKSKLPRTRPRRVTARSVSNRKQSSSEVMV